MDYRFRYFANANIPLIIIFFRNLSMIAYIIEIKKSKFANIKSVNLTKLSQVAKLNSEYIFIL